MNRNGRQNDFNGGWDGGWGRAVMRPRDVSSDGGWNGAWDGGWDGGWNGGWGGGGFARAAALTLAREGTINPADFGASAKPDGDKLVVGEIMWHRWWRLAPNVQIDLMVGELLPLFSVVTINGENAVALDIEGTTNALVKLVRPKRSVFVAELGAVLAAAELREERAAEIVAQAGGFSDFFEPALPLARAQRPNTELLLAAISRVCTILVMRIKASFGCYRPSELSPEVQPMIPVPGHSTFPMGHAVQSFAVATMFSDLFTTIYGANDSKEARALFGRIASRISTNRVIAGLHFPVDLPAGAALGVAIVEAIIGKFKSAEASRKDVIHNFGVEATMRYETYTHLVFAGMSIEWNQFVNGSAAPAIFSAFTPTKTTKAATAGKKKTAKVGKR